MLSKVLEMKKKQIRNKNLNILILEGEEEKSYWEKNILRKDKKTSQKEKISQ